MKIFDYSSGKFAEADSFPEDAHSSDTLFILCYSSEITRLHSIFDFDESTVLNCTDLDEIVRYTAYEGYDFVSLTHMELEHDNIRLREINIYISGHYLIIVLPLHESPRLTYLEIALLKSAEKFMDGDNQIVRLYFTFFHDLLTDFSDMLEELEDYIEAFSESLIIKEAEDNQLIDISALRRMTYTVKKQLRAMSYLGTQILMDQNGLLDKKQTRYFHNIDMRLKRLYDFAANLYELGNELLYTYDSRLTMQMTDTVNKLTTLTIFFGPLTVITGIYGMNFDSMPELKWAFGYPLALGIMVFVSMVIYIVLKKKKWL